MTVKRMAFPRYLLLDPRTLVLRHLRTLQLILDLQAVLSLPCFRVEVVRD